MTLLEQIGRLLAMAGIRDDPAAVIPVYLLVMARFGSAIPFISFLGGESVPGPVRATLAMLVALALYPSLATGFPSGQPVAFDFFFALLIKEVLIGTLFGVLVKIVFSAAEAAGSLLESAAGLRPQEILAPQLSSSTGPFSLLFGQTAIVLYLAAGVHLLLLQTIADSYVTVPLNQFPRFGPGFLPVAIAAGQLTAQFVTFAVRISAPVLFLLLMIKVGTGLVFRASFRQLSEDSFQPLSGLAVMGMVLFGAGIYEQEIVRAGADFLRTFSRFIGTFG